LSLVYLAKLCLSLPTVIFIIQEMGVGFDHEKTVYYSESFIAGFLGGIVTRALVCPLDVLKIRFQVNKVLTF